MNIYFLTLIAVTFFTVNGELNNNQFLNFDENETAIQLKIFDSALRFDKHAQVADKALTISMEVLHAAGEHPQWKSDNVSVSQLIPDHSEFVKVQNGIDYQPETMITFFVNTTTPQSTHFRFVIQRNAITTFTDLHAVMPPFQDTETSGERNLTIIDTKQHIPVGEIRVSFLIIRPCEACRNGPKKSDVEPDNGGDKITLMGHRGTGVFVRKDLPQQFIENSIDAFNYACDHGAHMIELDVQLTSDGVPVIYHDFAVTTFLPKRQFHDLSKNFTFHIPLKDLSKQQLDMINTNFMPSVDGQNITHQSFETLEDVLKGIRPNCGINVEIKYPQIFDNGQWDGARGFELNKYVDSILAVMNAHHGNRKIVITSFHPDLCVMVQLKQKRFQVAFLTSGDRAINNPKARWIWDPRTHTVDKNTAFAVSANLHGLSLLTLDVLEHSQNIRYIRDRKLSLYLWGDQLNSWERIQTLYKAGVNGFIFDHLDQIVPQK